MSTKQWQNMTPAEKALALACIPTQETGIERTTSNCEALPVGDRAPGETYGAFGGDEQC